MNSILILQVVNSNDGEVLASSPQLLFSTTPESAEKEIASITEKYKSKILHCGFFESKIHIESKFMNDYEI